MNQQHTPEPLVLPPDNPPSRRSSVALTSVSIMLVLVWFLLGITTNEGYGASDISHQVLTFALMFWYLPAAFILACVAMNVESSRVKYKTVVTEYSRKTGDMRYNPYILPTHPFLVIGGNLLWMFAVIAVPTVNGLMNHG